MLSRELRDSVEVERRVDAAASQRLLQAASPKSLQLNRVAVTNLLVAGLKRKLNGWNVELALDPAYTRAGSKMNDGDIRTGDLVGVGRLPAGDTRSFPVQGIVSSITGTKCVVYVGTQRGDDIESSADGAAVAQAGNRSGSTDPTGDFPLQAGQRAWILKLMNETPYKRMEQAMNKLAAVESALGGGIIEPVEPSGEVSASPVADVLLGHRGPSVGTATIPTLPSTLNASQIAAITYALSSELCVIHGPPGTGKTRTVVEFILASLRANPNKRILVTAGSNVAVDTILERLVVHRDVLSPAHVVRVGHPAKMLSALSTDTEVLDLSKKVKGVKLRERRERRAAKRENRPQVSQLDTSGLSPLQYREHLLNTTHLQHILHANFQPVLQGIREDLKTLETQLGKPGTRYAERKALYKQARDLQKEQRVREHTALMEVLRTAKVVIGTVVGVGANDVFFGVKDLQKESPEPFFDTLVIDEVSQTLEPGCWIPILGYNPRKLVLAGDNHQLAPTVHCSDEGDDDSGIANIPPALQAKAKSTLTKTLFDRLLAVHKDHSFVKFLNVQYRMNDPIQDFSSTEFYKGQLVADESVKAHTLAELLPEASPSDGLSTLVWEDTCGLHPETADEESGSKYNVGEAHLAKAHIARLVAMGLRQEDIGVIAPYSAQVSKLRDVLWARDEDGDSTAFPGVEISTVDGFQGREKEVIVLTLVRSNDKHEVGFLKDYRRLNVSITRAKRQLYVVGDYDTISHSSAGFLRSWAAHMETHALVKYVEN